MPHPPSSPSPSCEAATCRKKSPAVVEVSGEITEGQLHKTITLKLCAECAGPLLKSGQPLGASMSAHLEN